MRHPHHISFSLCSARSLRINKLESDVCQESQSRVLVTHTHLELLGVIYAEVLDVYSALGFVGDALLGDRDGHSGQGAALDGLGEDVVIHLWGRWRCAIAPSGRTRIELVTYEPRGPRTTKILFSFISSSHLSSGSEGTTWGPFPCEGPTWGLSRVKDRPGGLSRVKDRPGGLSRALSPSLVTHLSSLDRVDHVLGRHQVLQQDDIGRATRKLRDSRSGRDAYVRGGADKRKGENQWT